MRTAAVQVSCAKPQYCTQYVLQDVGMHSTKLSVRRTVQFWFLVLVLVFGKRVILYRTYLLRGYMRYMPGAKQLFFNRSCSYTLYLIPGFFLMRAKLVRMFCKKRTQQNFPVRRVGDVPK